MLSTVSVSKGVFAFKRKRGDSSTKSSKRRKSSNEIFWPENEISGSQQKMNFQACWSAIENALKKLEKEVHSEVFKELVQFVENQTMENEVGRKSLPTAVLVMGVNMPDSEQVLLNVEEQLKRSSARVVRLHSRHCTTLKVCILNLVSQLFNFQTDVTISSDSEDKLDSPRKKNLGVKKSNCTMEALEAWFHEQRMIGNEPRNITVVLEDVEGLSSAVLQDFIQILSWHQRLPLVLVLCVATSPAVVHARLSQSVLASLAITTFQARPSHHYLGTLVDTVLMDNSLVMHVGGLAFKQLIDMFLYHHLSINNFVNGYKYCMLEHFLQNAASVVCCPSSRRSSVVKALTEKQINSLQRLPSFRRFIEMLPPEERRSLLLDGEAFKKCLLEKLKLLDEYWVRLCNTVRVFHRIAAILPGAPLGRQVWSLFSLCLNSSAMDTDEFKEAWRCVQTLNRQELMAFLPNSISILTQSGDIHLKNAGDTLGQIMQDIIQLEGDLLQGETQDETYLTSPEKPSKHLLSLEPMDRFKLKERLQELAKQKQKKPHKFQSLRQEVLSVLQDLCESFLLPPSTHTFHEAFFFSGCSDLADRLQGRQRAAINRALLHPSHYLQCECCEVRDSKLPPLQSSLPDLCVAYRLHSECGRYINLYDWLVAFAACQGAEDLDSNSAQSELFQARFAQAVSELQFLGFIKTSKRKADHVTRLTWGTC